MEPWRLDELCPLPDLGALPRVLTRADAYQLGITARSIAHRVHAQQWQRVLPRVYLTVDTFT